MAGGSGLVPERNRRILCVAMKYAIRQRILRTNPLPKGKESTAVTKTTKPVGKRFALNPQQTAAILDWIRRRPRDGKGPTWGGPRTT